MILGHEQPYSVLQRLKLRELREELRGRSVSLTGNAIDLASELWRIEDVSRFKPPIHSGRLGWRDGTYHIR